MIGRLPSVLRDSIDWLIDRPLYRLAAACVFWALVIAALLRFADRLVWLGFAPGVLLPVSLWIAWEGFSVPGRRHLDS